MAKVLVNFQDEFLDQIDKIAECEHRTRSSLIREALRRYISSYKTEDQEKDNSTQISSLHPNKIILPVSKVS